MAIIIRVDDTLMDLESDRRMLWLQANAIYSTEHRLAVFLNEANARKAFDTIVSQIKEECEASGSLFIPYHLRMREE